MKSCPANLYSKTEFRLSTASHRTVINDGQKSCIFVTKKQCAAENKQSLLFDFIPLLQAIFQESSDFVAIFALDESVAYINRSAEQMLGYTLQHMQTLAHTEKFIAFRQVLKNVMQTGQAHSYECSALSVGSEDSMRNLMKITAIKNLQQEIIGVIAVGRDLSDDGHDQHGMLVQKESYQRALIDNFPFIVWLKDIDSRFLAINNTYASLIGVQSPADAIGKNDYDYFPQSVADGYVAFDHEVMLSGESKIMVEAIHGDGDRIHWAEVYKSPVIVDNKIIGTVGFARDLTEFKKLHDDISQTKSDYVSLIENLPLAIIRYNLDCQRVFINDYCLQVFGAPAEPLIGKRPTEYWYASATGMKAHEFEARIKAVMQTGLVDTFEFNCILNSKKSVYLMRLAPELDANKNVKGAIALASDMTAVSQYRDQIEYMAYHDSLTGLPNRATFNKCTAEAIAQAKHSDQSISVLMIDLDHFKSINDTLGHVVGDTLLIEVAQRLVKVLRAGDSVARLGGDEFSVLIQGFSQSPELAALDLAKLAAKIVQEMALPFNVSGQELYVTASIGIAIYPNDTESVDDLLKYADVAMYAAKKQGRNNYQFFVKELSQNIAQRLVLQTELMHAIEKNEFYLHYQPLVNLLTAEVVGVEALLRWKNKALGEVNPADFIPLAEELGIITEIGRWVMVRAFADAVTINAARATPIQVAVNLSARQFLRYDVFSAARYCLSITNCNPAWITLEITESVLLNDSSQVLEVLKNFVDLGLKIAIDDFGTGYSSLSYLNKFPISEVKIDRSFVSDISEDENAAKLVKAVIGMAVSLGKELIAEGVETQEQANLLKSWGCNIGQGYLFSKPLGFEQLLQRL